MVQSRPSLWGQLVARLEGEMPAETLEAYRRAGRAVYDLLDRVEEERLTCKIEGRDPWSVAAAAQAELLCAWNAFVLQTLGDQFLEADYRLNPTTVGFVPPVTAEQVLAFYTQVEPWLSRAHQARSNPAYRLDVAVPADLPPWTEVDPCPNAHLEGTLAAARSIRSHAEAALAVFQEQALPPERKPSVQRLQQLVAEAGSKAGYAEQLWAGSPPQSLHEQIERYAHEAVERYFHLGQLLAMPSLVDSFDQRGAVQARPTASAGARLPGPGEPGFDPWRLTDPASRAAWQRDPAARRAIQSLWAADPDPRRTLAIQVEIEAALARGDIAYATKPSGERLGFYYCCPWAPVYVAKRSVTIGGRRLRTLQQFTYDVSAEDMPRGGAFEREILPGAFGSTDEVDYCDPRAGGHD